MGGTASSDERLVGFASPARFLADLDPATTGRVIASAADVALIVERGVIRDVALGSAELTREGYERSWLDKAWIDTVTPESRAKIEDLLRPGADGPRWRQVNHPSVAGVDVPVRYTAVPIHDEDRLVALGRDLRSIARLQQRLVEAHQGLERDYARMREAEARYRLLFRTISQPVLIVEPTSLRVEDANPAAARALGAPVESLVGASLVDWFASECRPDLARTVAESLSIGEAATTGLQASDGAACDVVASAFREEDATRVIVRLETEDSRGESPASASHTLLLGVLEELPDGLVVAGPDLRILAANRAFVEMARLVHRGQMVGGRLSEYLGRSPTDLNVLVSNLKSHGVVRNFATVLRDQFGREEDVEVSAVAAPGRDAPSYGFCVRGVARRLRSGPSIREELPSSAEQLTSLVGRVPLREIVRQSTDFIEKLCIEAALEITADNRASAAEMLGLSRQGLYSKLKRFGLDDTR